MMHERESGRGMRDAAAPPLGEFGGYIPPGLGDVLRHGRWPEMRGLRSSRHRAAAGQFT